MTELISRATRSIFRRLMTDSYVGEIATAFQDEGFAPNPDSTYEDSSIRRQTTQTYLESVDWTDPGHVGRVLRVFERLLDDWDPDGLRSLRNALLRDGYATDPETGHITPVGARLAVGNLAHLKDASAIREQLARIQRAVLDDPALAVGSAKELIESTAKVVLTERGVPVDDTMGIPALVKEAQQLLDLHPSAHTPGPDGSDAIKRILGSVSGIAIGLAELRNRGYGTGHGPATTRVGLRPRHAHLAVNAALTWCQLMLDTLADPEAPWQTRARAEAAAQAGPP
ncbi:abortive infection family protein [Embleya sp. NPDC050493]|uniref:abortive infection family protein n=1 Tax=Embleya sp. NPDC050493 TaxID=3363989 RepID=UPI0037891DD2